MGLAVLPSRLKGEMEQLADYIVNGKDLRSNEALAKHADWVEAFSKNYDHIDSANINEILQQEIGKVFCEVLECAGVYKNTDEGMEAFLRFVNSL